MWSNSDSNSNWSYVPPYFDSNSDGSSSSASPGATQTEAPLRLTWCYSDSYSEWNSFQPHLVLLRLILRLNLVRSYRVSDFTCRRRTITQIEELIKISVTIRLPVAFLSFSSVNLKNTRPLGVPIIYFQTILEEISPSCGVTDTPFGTWNSKPTAISLCALSPEAWWIPQTLLWV